MRVYSQTTIPSPQIRQEVLILAAFDVNVRIGEVELIEQMLAHV